MRNIKFRIWDTNKNQWLKQEDWIGINNYGIVYDDRSHDYPDLSLRDSCIIQQYIMIKDKNGREIYEGDIIQYNYPKNERNNKVLVRWTTEEYDNHPGFIICDSFEQYGDYEVIGNIYENPNLITF